MEKVNLFVVGARKSGTSTLHEVFSKIGAVFTPTKTESNSFFETSFSCNRQKYIHASM